MSRFRKVSFLVTAVLIVIFLLMSSTDLIFKEEVTEVKKIAVFVAADEHPYLDNFKKGIQAAASDNRVDVNYVTASGSEEDMLERTVRKYDSDVQAVILFSECPGLVSRYFEINPPKIPVITVNTFGDASDRAADVSFDVQDAAEALAQEIQGRYGEAAETVLLADEEEISGQVRQILVQVFREKGLAAECTELSPEKIRRFQEKLEKPIFVGCWISETEQAMEYLDGDVLYGVGYSNEILRGIREGKVVGVEAFGMYETGIYAMQQAISAIESEAEDVRIPCRLITEENIEEQQEFLIPVY